MMTIDEIRAELAHLREVPARLRLERLMRDKGGLVDMLEGMLDGAPQHGWLEYRSRIQGEPIDETLLGATTLSVSQLGFEREGGQVIEGGFVGGRDPIKRKRGRPARRVESGGEA
jgi:hypothetical protein